MKKWIFSFGILAFTLACSNDVPPIEFNSLLIGSACDGENLMNNMGDYMIPIDPQSDFAHYNSIAQEVGQPSLDLSEGEVTLNDYILMVNQVPTFLGAMQSQLKKGILSDKVLAEIEIQKGGKDRCCSIVCECGTVNELHLTIFDIGKFKGKQTCRYFRNIAEGPYEDVKKLFDENKEDLPSELLELGPILESIWSPAESCDYDLNTGACEIE